MTKSKPQQPTDKPQQGTCLLLETENRIKDSSVVQLHTNNPQIPCCALLKPITFLAMIWHPGGHRFDHVLRTGSSSSYTVVSSSKGKMG